MLQSAIPTLTVSPGKPVYYNLTSLKVLLTLKSYDSKHVSVLLPLYSILTLLPPS